MIPGERPGSLPWVAVHSEPQRFLPGWVRVRLGDDTVRLVDYTRGSVGHNREVYKLGSVGHNREVYELGSVRHNREVYRW